MIRPDGEQDTSANLDVMSRDASPQVNDPTPTGNTILVPPEYVALLDHTQSCEQCSDDQKLCGPGTELRRKLKEVRR
ncbi:hypothetical protein [Streptomyces sp. NPDC047123]|uniref:hypothetical protein n=1 Tax=Streptomyces sp. NPDC047123 TaxID=3155622 RepID=UPI0033FD36FB